MKNPLDWVWNAWGLFCGIILALSMFSELGNLYEIALGGGSAWIICEVVFGKILFASQEDSE